ncbi:two-component sensor histidine kinase [Pleurocapsales cyanobacterium LEGE 06147]|nr:two-component sensor histidine kinase [Pleurocapsales cyanobacterium LEGE 06147]
MALGQSSFRRILLSRLLLLSVPVLLMGVYVTYRKARSAFLDTARQNLTESAVRKGDYIKQSIEALKTNLASASDTELLKSESPQQQQAYISQLVKILPTNILCAQLTDIQADRITATTCTESIAVVDHNLWQQQQDRLLVSPEQIEIKLLPSSVSDLSINGTYKLRRRMRDLSTYGADKRANSINSIWETTPYQEDNFSPALNQLVLWLSAPVYDNMGQLRYVLSVKSAILSNEKVEPGSLDGYAVVINQAGNILAHPYIQRVGQNINQMSDAQRLQSILNNAIKGRTDSLHLFYLDKDGVELVAGYSSIPSPITSEREQKWIVLAVTPLGEALLPLQDIQEVLVFMTVGLITASALATLYVSRPLARPLEQLRDYALKQEHFHSTEQLPQNFQIREFNQLAIALNEMVARLRAWGEEIVSAWKEAQNANQLKNEFLATTSHELRTPLNGIINCIRLVKEGYCDSKEEEIEFLEQADDAAIHLLKIINDVLDISKIEAGKLSVTLEKVNLQKILGEVIDLQTVPIQRKRLEFKTPIWQENIFVHADPAKLKQVLLNVLGNAIKFTESGSIEIEVKVEQENQQVELTDSTEPSLLQNQDLSISKTTAETKHNGDRSSSSEMLMNDLDSQSDNDLSPSSAINRKVIITISDTGIGIDPNQQDKLFRPFVMVDGSTTRKFGGTGLGLAISRNLIELMGGTISLDSPGEGQGTTVNISLPLVEIIPVADFASQNPNSAQKRQTSTRTDYRVNGSNQQN